MPILTIKIVNQGTAETENGRTSTSTAGHMWYTITDDNGHADSYGFAPIKEGDFDGRGDVNPRGKDDNERYAFDSSENGGDYSRSITISQEQYDLLKDFGLRPQNYGFDKDHYNALTNSCIDFTWKALELSGLNPNGFQGDSWPTNNIDNIEKINPANPESANFEKSPDSDGLVKGAIKDYLNSLISDSHTISTFIQSSFNSLFTAESITSAPALPRRVDPLTLDLDNDGVELISVNNSTAFFDLDVTPELDSNGNPTGRYLSDGVKEQVGWVNSNDGLLTLDRNNNGTVDNILELFGKTNKTGTEELREYDLNNDGVINSSDSVFSQFSV